ncbi:MAG TPA: VWA domain-containing protein [Thermoguttaceae bacterium]|nr:VWA domain-containing protein [Thermoguttaceae bacterium]
MGDNSWQIGIAQPLGLLALVVLPVVVYYSRRSLVHFARWQRRTSLTVRLLLIVLLAMVLCGLQLVKQSDQLFVVFAVDQSRSISETAQAAADAFVAKANEHLGDHRSVVLPFAEINHDATDLSAAILASEVPMPADCVPRIVLLSDGNQTQGDALAAARAATVEIWTVPLPGRAENEVAVSAVRAPAQVRQGEAFDVEVVVESSGPNQGHVELLAGNEPVAVEETSLKAGENRIRFRCRAIRQPDVTLTAVLHDFQDTLPENNRLSAVVLVSDRPRVLLVENRTVLAEPLATALDRESIDAEVRPPEEFSETLAGLQPYDVVILSNIPATSLPTERMAILRQYVEETGGGLIVIGGDRAFTAGNYRHTELEAVLPVVSEASGKTEKPGLAMVLVIDCSVSMKGQSIALAREATRRAVEMLGPADQVAILAFTEETRWVSELTHCTDAAKQQLLARIETIDALGRTNMYPAIEKAYLALNEAYAPLKHMIVLTDGVSHPGDFERLARDVAASGITISTVAIGSEAVPALLEQIAQIGGGHFYFCDDAAAVPKIFATEAAAAAKIGIVERPFSPNTVDTAAIFADLNLAGLPTLLGYVETQPKPSAHVVLASESGDPLLAWWQAGLGTSVAFTSDIQNRWATTWLGWSDFGRFWARLVRHAMRKRPPRDFTIETQRHGQHTRVILDAIDRQGRFLNGAQASIRIELPDQVPNTMNFIQVAPGRYAVEFPTPESGTYGLTATFQLEGRPIQTERLALSVGYAEELRVRETNDALLQSIATATDGRFDPTAEQVFGEPDTTARCTTPLWPYLAALAVLLFLLDMTLKRVDLA